MSGVELVVLTKNQAKAIEIFRENNNNNAQILGIHFSKGAVTKLHKDLQTMYVDDLAKALYIGYEIEQPEYEVGEKVVSNFDSSYEVGSVTAVSECGKGLTVSFRTHMVSTAAIHFRYATKEEAFWAELGREVNEIIEGDVVSTKFDYSYEVVSDLVNTTRKTCTVNDVLGWIAEGSVKGIYPAESLKLFPIGCAAK